MCLLTFLFYIILVDKHEKGKIEAEMGNFIGDTIIINNDTLIIKSYDLYSEEFTLSNGFYIDERILKNRNDSNK